MRRGNLALVVAAAADAVHPFGEVHRLEVSGEGAYQVAGVVERDAFPAPAPVRPRRGVAFAAADRGAAQAFDFLEELRRTLLGEDLADQRAEHVHVFAQQRVGGRELDIAQGLLGDREGSCRRV